MGSEPLPPPNHCHRGTLTLSSCILRPALSRCAGLQGPTVLPRGPPSPFLPGALNELGASIWHAGVHTTTRWASPPPRGVHSPPHAACPHHVGLIAATGTNPCQVQLIPHLTAARPCPPP